MDLRAINSSTCVIVSVASSTKTATLLISFKPSPHRVIEVGIRQRAAMQDWISNARISVDQQLLKRLGEFDANLPPLLLSLVANAR